MGAYDKEDGAGSAWWLALLIVPLLAVFGSGLFMWRRATHEEALARLQVQHARDVRDRTELEASAALALGEQVRAAESGAERAASGANASGGERRAPVRDGQVIEPEASAPVPLHGRVIDEFGGPVPGVSVVLHPLGIELAQPGFDSDFLNGRTSSVGPGKSSTRARSATTDAEGRFELADDLPQEGDEFGYARELYSGGEPRQEVLLDGMEQLLRLPPPPSTIVIVELLDQSGAALDPHSAHARRVRGRQPLVRLEPHPRNVRLESGRVTFVGLGAGEWDLTLRGARSRPVSVKAVVTTETDVLRLEARTHDFGGTSVWLTSSLGAVAEPVPTPDETNGFASWAIKGQGKRGFRDRRANAYFNHTISGFGTGPVRAAYLDLLLQAHPGNSKNDTLHLEFRGPGALPRFEWSYSIQKLTGTSWERGATARLTLDLAALPTQDGPLNLLPHLEDGRLDILVTDDTSVEHLDLFVLP